MITAYPYIKFNMGTVIDEYQIKFIKRLIDGQSFEVMSSLNSTLDQCITDYYQVDDISEFLIAKVNDILNGVSQPDLLVSESSILINVSVSITQLYKNPDASPHDTPDFSLPTSDFRDIATAWLNFLQSGN